MDDLNPEWTYPIIIGTSTTTTNDLRQLDAEVAEKVMGWRRYAEAVHPTDNRTINGVLYCRPEYPAHNFGGALNVVPDYSTDIAAAMAVADKMVEKGHVFIIKGDGLRTGDHNPRWTILCDNTPRIDGHDLPEAICRAALVASQAAKTDAPDCQPGESARRAFRDVDGQMPDDLFYD